MGIADKIRQDRARQDELLRRWFRTSHGSRWAIARPQDLMQDGETLEQLVEDFYALGQRGAVEALSQVDFQVTRAGVRIAEGALSPEELKQWRATCYRVLEHLCEEAKGRTDVALTLGDAIAKEQLDESKAAAMACYLEDQYWIKAVSMSGLYEITETGIDRVLRAA